MEDLEATIRGLVARQAIEDVLAAYCHAIDSGDSDTWAGCFTDDAVLEIVDATGELRETFRGHPELEAFARRYSTRPEAFHQHRVGEILATVDDDRAQARSQFSVVVHHGRRVTHQVFGRYEDQLRCAADGRWAISTRRVLIDGADPDLPPLRP